MKQIAAALVKAQRQRHTPEGRMLEASLLRQSFPPDSGGRNHVTAGTPLERLNRMVIFGASTCWYWRGHTDALGYGRFYALGENKAHRASYRIFRGAIPDGMKVLHTCDTRCCVNPEHLMLGTQADNVADMHAKGRRRQADVRGERNPMARLTVQAVAAIRAMRAQGTPQIELARRFGVSPMTISRAVRGESWK